MGFPDSSAGKESACNVGDPGLIPGSGRSPGEGLGYPLQYSWASLVTQTIKNLPAMQEIWVWSLGWEDPLEEGMAHRPSILFWRIPWTEEPGGLQSMRSQRVGHDWKTEHTNAHISGVYMPVPISRWWLELHVCIAEGADLFPDQGAKILKAKQHASHPPAKKKKVFEGWFTLILRSCALPELTWLNSFSSSWIYEHSSSSASPTCYHWKGSSWTYLSSVCPPTQSLCMFCKYSSSLQDVGVNTRIFVERKLIYVLMFESKWEEKMTNQESIPWAGGCITSGVFKPHTEIGMPGREKGLREIGWF